MMVNGNIGAGVAVAGAFSLVRFRSAQGTGQEITMIFLAMAVGLMAGMGYLLIAAVFTAIVLVSYLLLQKTGFGSGNAKERTLKVTVPETLDFEGIFDDIFAKYTAGAELTDVRTSGMGSMYRLSYRIVMRDGLSVKRMIDEMRYKNRRALISTRKEDRKMKKQVVLKLLAAMTAASLTVTGCAGTNAAAGNKTMVISEADTETSAGDTETASAAAESSEGGSTEVGSSEVRRRQHRSRLIGREYGGTPC